MARRVFFSFHFQRDAWRVGVVRNSPVTQSFDAPPFLDAVAWEKVQRAGDAAIQQWIDSQLQGTSVTAVLIGAETANRPWVQYEIKESYKRQNGILGVYINAIKNQNLQTDVRGPNPLDMLGVQVNGVWTRLSQYYYTYDWIADNGYANFGTWVEVAAKNAGR